MQPLGDPVRHFWLAKRMGTLTDAGLCEAFADGRLSSQEWAATITRCRGCTWAEGCATWQEEQALSSEPVEPPSTCPNAAVFLRLREAQEA